MNDFDLGQYLAAVKRRLPLVIAVGLSIAAAIGTISALLPPSYRAATKILIEPPQIPENLARPTVTAGGLEQIQIIQQQMMTAPVLLDLAERLHIYDNRPNISPNDVVTAMRAHTEFSTQPLQTATAGGATVVTVSYDAASPKLALDVVASMAQRMVSENSEQRVGQAGDTLVFFQQEVVRLGNELKVIEGRILEFKNANKDALPDSLEFRRNQQSAQQERLTALQREEATLRDRRATIVKTYSDFDTTVNASQLATPAEQTLADLKKTLIQQQLVYSDQSQNIIVLKSQIAKLEEQVKAERAAQVGAPQGSGPPSPYQVQIAEIDGRLNYINLERASIQKSLDGLTQSIVATPANEVTLNSLQRNLQNIQAQYNAATARLADASTGEQIEIRSKGVKFTIVDAPRLQAESLSSKRALLAGAGIVGGLFAALALVFILEFFSKTIKRPVDLARGLQIMPFGTVPYIYSPKERTTRFATAAISLAFALILIPSAIVTFDRFVMPIDVLMLKFTRTGNAAYR